MKEFTLPFVRLNFRMQSRWDGCYCQWVNAVLLNISLKMQHNNIFSSIIACPKPKQGINLLRQRQNIQSQIRLLKIGISQNINIKFYDDQKLSCESFYDTYNFMGGQLDTCGVLPNFREFTNQSLMLSRNSELHFYGRLLLHSALVSQTFKFSLCVVL